MSIEGSKQTLEFQTDSTGVYGLGTGYFVLSPGDGRGVEYPAAWRNTDPQRISITGEIKFTADEKLKSGTLLLRTVLQPGQGIKGDALFIDEQLTVHRGTFTMKELLGREIPLSEVEDRVLARFAEVFESAPEEAKVVNRKP